MVGMSFEKQLLIKRDNCILLNAKGKKLRANCAILVIFRGPSPSAGTRVPKKSKTRGPKLLTDFLTIITNLA